MNCLTVLTGIDEKVEVLFVCYFVGSRSIMLNDGCEFL